MALSVRERIVRAVLQRVTAAVAPVPVIRPPTVPVSREAGATLLLSLESDSIDAHANAVVDRSLRIRLTAVAQGPLASEEADSALVLAHAALMQAPNLEGLSLGIREVEADWDTDNLDAGSLALPARYEIRYRTMAVDLTQMG
jgi:hypothetical protein